MPIAKRGLLPRIVAVLTVACLLAEPVSASCSPSAFAASAPVPASRTEFGRQALLVPVLLVLHPFSIHAATSVLRDAWVLLVIAPLAMAAMPQQSPQDHRALTKRFHDELKKLLKTHQLTMDDAALSDAGLGQTMETGRISVHGTVTRTARRALEALVDKYVKKWAKLGPAKSNLPDFAVPQTPDEMIQQADALYTAKNLPAALDLYTKIHDESQKNAATWFSSLYMRIQLLNELSRYREAMDLLETYRPTLEQVWAAGFPIKENLINHQFETAARGLGEYEKAAQYALAGIRVLEAALAHSRSYRPKPVPPRMIPVNDALRELARRNLKLGNMYRDMHRSADAVETLRRARQWALEPRDEGEKQDDEDKELEKSRELSERIRINSALAEALLERTPGEPDYEAIHALLLEAIGWASSDQTTPENRMREAKLRLRLAVDALDPLDLHAKAVEVLEESPEIESPEVAVLIKRAAAWMYYLVEDLGGAWRALNDALLRSQWTPEMQLLETIVDVRRAENDADQAAEAELALPHSKVTLEVGDVTRVEEHPDTRAANRARSFRHHARFEFALAFGLKRFWDFLVAVDIIPASGVPDPGVSLKDQIQTLTTLLRQEPIRAQLSKQGQMFVPLLTSLGSLASDLRWLDSAQKLFEAAYSYQQDPEVAFYRDVIPAYWQENADAKKRLEETRAIIENKPTRYLYLEHRGMLEEFESSIRDFAESAEAMRARVWEIARIRLGRDALDIDLLGRFEELSPAELATRLHPFYGYRRRDIVEDLYRKQLARMDHTISPRVPARLAAAIDNAGYPVVVGKRILTRMARAGLSADRSDALMKTFEQWIRFKGSEEQLLRHIREQLAKEPKPQKTSQAISLTEGLLRALAAVRSHRDEKGFSLTGTLLALFAVLGIGAALAPQLKGSLELASVIVEPVVVTLGFLGLSFVIITLIAAMIFRLPVNWGHQLGQGFIRMLTWNDAWGFRRKADRRRARDVWSLRRRLLTAVQEPDSDLRAIDDSTGAGWRYYDYGAKRTLLRRSERVLVAALKQARFQMARFVANPSEPDFRQYLQSALGELQLRADEVKVPLSISDLGQPAVRGLRLLMDEDQRLYQTLWPQFNEVFVDASRLVARNSLARLVRIAVLTGFAFVGMFGIAEAGILERYHAWIHASVSHLVGSVVAGLLAGYLLGMVTNSIRIPSRLSRVYLRLRSAFLIYCVMNIWWMVPYLGYLGWRHPSLPAFTWTGYFVWPQLAGAALWTATAFSVEKVLDLYQWWRDREAWRILHQIARENPGIRVSKAEVAGWIMEALSVYESYRPFAQHLQSSGLWPKDQDLNPNSPTFHRITELMWESFQASAVPWFPASEYAGAGMFSQKVSVNGQTFHLLGIVHGTDLEPRNVEVVHQVVAQLRQLGIPLYTEENFKTHFNLDYGREIDDHIRINDRTMYLSRVLLTLIAMPLWLFRKEEDRATVSLGFLRPQFASLSRSKYMADKMYEMSHGGPEVAGLVGAGHVHDAAVRLAAKAGPVLPRNGYLVLELTGAITLASASLAALLLILPAMALGVPVLAGMAWLAGRFFDQNPLRRPRVSRVLAAA